MKPVVGIALMAVGLALPQAALGDNTSVYDPRGDAEGDVAALDIRKAVAKHEGAKLKHVIRVDDASSVTSADTVYLEIRAGGKRYNVFGGTSNENVVIVRYDGLTYTETGKGTADRDKNRLIYRFSPDALGNPASYRWKAFTRVDPTMAGGTIDRAPNKDKFKRHALSASAAAR